MWLNHCWDVSRDRPFSKEQERGPQEKAKGPVGEWANDVHPPGEEKQLRPLVRKKARPPWTTEICHRTRHGFAGEGGDRASAAAPGVTLPGPDVTGRRPSAREALSKNFLVYVCLWVFFFFFLHYPWISAKTLITEKKKSPHNVIIIIIDKNALLPFASNEHWAPTMPYA